MTEQRTLSEPKSTLGTNQKSADKLREAAVLLINHGDVGADNALKTFLDGELRIWDFLWREKLQNLTERAAHVLGDGHRAIVLLREVLDFPWPIGLDESPEDPKDL